MSERFSGIITTQLERADDPNESIQNRIVAYNIVAGFILSLSPEDLKPVLDIRNMNSIDDLKAYIARQLIKINNISSPISNNELLTSDTDLAKKITFNRIIGMDDAKSALSHYVLNPLIYPSLSPFNNKVLIYGAKGTGKSLIANAVPLQLLYESCRRDDVPALIINVSRCSTENITCTPYRYTNEMDIGVPKVVNFVIMDNLPFGFILGSLPENTIVIGNSQHKLPGWGAYVETRNPYRKEIGDMLNSGISGILYQNIMASTRAYTSENGVQDNKTTVCDYVASKIPVDLWREYEEFMDITPEYLNKLALYMENNNYSFGDVQNCLDECKNVMVHNAIHNNCFIQQKVKYPAQINDELDTYITVWLSALSILKKHVAVEYRYLTGFIPDIYGHELPRIIKINWSGIVQYENTRMHPRIQGITDKPYVYVYHTDSRTINTNAIAIIDMCINYVNPNAIITKEISNVLSEPFTVENYVKIKNAVIPLLKQPMRFVCKINVNMDKLDEYMVDPERDLLAYLMNGHTISVLMPSNNKMVLLPVNSKLDSAIRLAISKSERVVNMNGDIGINLTPSIDVEYVYENIPDHSILTASENPINIYLNGYDLFRVCKLKN